MLIRIVLAGLLLTLSPRSLSHAQGTPASAVGWYNGDRQFGIGGYSNWYLSETQFGRTYDDFVVPAGGWTVAGVFSNDTLYSGAQVTQASWEIRSGVSAGSGGTVIASGLNPATQTYNPSTDSYRIEVDGLNVQLQPGTYWVSVTPAGTAQGQSYVCATTGANAFGYPLGNDGNAFYYLPPQYSFIAVQASGTGGTTGDFSQGVLISAGTTAVSVPNLWQSDVASLVQQMPLFHSVPYPGISLADFNAKAADLSARIPTISDAEIRTGFQALVASINDPHTVVGWSSPSPFRYLPLSFYWFDDGIYVTAAPAQYQNLLGGKLTSVGNSGIDDAVQRLSPLVARDNDWWLKSQLPGNILYNTDFLFGTGVTGSTDDAQIVAQSPTGDVVSADVQAVSQFPQMLPVFQGTPPLYRQNYPGKNYWATVIDGGATVYFQYNSCYEDPKQASADFFSQLDQMLAQDGVQRLIVDMRNNSGGLATILDPWIDKISATRFNQPGRLYVIVGRATFSAAMEATDFFRSKTLATFVGEPTGAKPQFLLRRGDFPLPYFGIRVSYSSGVEGADLMDSGPTLIPDIQTGLTFQDYMNGADPALDAILSQPLPAS